MKNLNKFVVFLILCQCWLGFSSSAHALNERPYYWDYVRLKKTIVPSETWAVDLPDFDRIALRLPQHSLASGGTTNEYPVFKLKEHFYTSTDTSVKIYLTGDNGMPARFIHAFFPICNGKPQEFKTYDNRFDGTKWVMPQSWRHVYYQCIPVADPVTEAPNTHGAIAHAHCMGVVDVGSPDQINHRCFLKPDSTRRALEELCDTAAERAEPRCTYIRTQLNLWKAANPTGTCNGCPNDNGMGNDVPKP
jgi:hypothetical protein